MFESTRDHANDPSEPSRTRSDKKSLGRIIDAANAARCVVKVITSFPDIYMRRNEQFGARADVRVMVISESYQLNGSVKANNDNPTEPPLLAYLEEYDEVSELLALRAGFADVLHPHMSDRILTERIMAAWLRGSAIGAQIESKDVFEKHSKLPFELDLINRVLTIDSMQISLSKTEVLILQILSKNFHRPVSREEIHAEISCNTSYDPRTVDSHIKRLRKKFIDAGLPQNMIKTIYGMGYRIGER